MTDLTLWDALRSLAFWVFALSSSAFGLAYSGISLFNESVLAERGLPANFAGGWMGSRWPLGRLMSAGMLVLGGALLALPLVSSMAHVMAYPCTMGVFCGIVTVVFFSVWGQAFGRTQLGRIQGCAQIMTVLASAVGPLVLAEAYQRTSSYASSDSRDPEGYSCRRHGGIKAMKPNQTLEHAPAIESNVSSGQSDGSISKRRPVVCPPRFPEPHLLCPVLNKTGAIGDSIRHSVREWAI